MLSSKNLSWFILLVISFASLATSKAQSLPIDESGKIFFSEVIVADSFPKEKLFLNGLRWLKSLTNTEDKFTATSIDSLKTQVSGNYEFQVFAQSGLLRKMVGLITCKLSLETKDNKYRYAFSEFTYHYYKEDRNYKLLKTGKTKPLEESKAAGWQKLWDKHKKTTDVKINNLIASMKTQLAKKEITQKEKEVKKKVEW